MDTAKRAEELAKQRQLSLFALARQCDISYSTLKNARQRGNQLSVDTIELICRGLGIKLSEFFAE